MTKKKSKIFLYDRGLERPMGFRPQIKNNNKNQKENGKRTVTIKEQGR